MNRQGIEGVPAHLKVIAFRAPKTGDYYLAWDFALRAQCSTYEDSKQIVEPDNVYGVYDLADVKIPEGYERTGELRTPEPQEWYVNRYGSTLERSLEMWSYDGDDTRRIIVKPVAKKTKRVLVAETELYVNATVISVEGRFEGARSHETFPISFRIEEREVS